MAQRRSYDRHPSETNYSASPHTYETISDVTSYDRLRGTFPDSDQYMTMTLTTTPEPRYVNQAAVLSKVADLTSTTSPGTSGLSALPHTGGVLSSSAYLSGRNRSASEMDKEIHLLRMSVSDKEAMIVALQSNLEHAHRQVKQLNTILAEKKEAILQYHERLSDMDSELADHREKSQQQAQQQMRGVPSAAEVEGRLQQQLQVVQRRLADSQEQFSRVSSENRELQVKLSRLENDRVKFEQQPLNDHEQFTLRTQVDRLAIERADLDRENRKLKSEVEFFKLQIAAYNEDFQNERADRERAHGQIMKLKEDGEGLKQFITLLSQEHNIRLGDYGMAELTANHH